MKFLNFFLLVCLVGTVLSVYAAMDDDFLSDRLSKFEDVIFNRARRDITCQRLQGYFVGHFVPCGRTRSSQLQLQVSLIINTTDQRIYGSVDYQNHTYSASGSIYLNLWNKDDDDGKYCNDTQSSCAYSYEEGAPFYASIFNNDGFFRLITQSTIQNDKFVLKNAVGRCINDPAQSLHWYPDKVSNVSWCVCCDDYESGGDLACPVNPWQPKEVNSA